MPIYEYACQACKTRFEVKQGVNDPPLSTCERCGGEVTKLISAPAIMFKGSGWYVTDYSDKLKPPASPSEPAAGKDKPDKSDGDGKKPAASGDGGATTPTTPASSTSGNGDKKAGGSPSSSSSPASSGSTTPSST